METKDEGIFCIGQLISVDEKNMTIDIKRVSLIDVLESVDREGRSKLATRRRKEFKLVVNNGKTRALC